MSAVRAAVRQKDLPALAVTTYERPAIGPSVVMTWIDPFRSSGRAWRSTIERLHSFRPGVVNTSGRPRFVWATHKNVRESVAAVQPDRPQLITRSNRSITCFLVPLVRTSMLECRITGITLSPALSLRGEALKNANPHPPPPTRPPHPL